MGGKMKIPFTIDQFLKLFESYNLAVFPVQWLAYLLGAAVVLGILTKWTRCPQLTALILASMWIWNGAVYHIAFFSRINPLAYLFGSLFILQGLFFLWNGVYRNDLRFDPKWNLQTITGGLFVLYALGIYPLLTQLFGHGWPQSPMFGVAPCPTTIFTFGLLLMSAARISVYLLVVPLMWSLVGMSAAINLKIVADYGLIAAGLIGTGAILCRNTAGRYVRAPKDR
jgi:hypothetical protein